MNKCKIKELSKVTNKDKMHIACKRFAYNFSNVRVVHYHADDMICFEKKFFSMEQFC